MEKRKEWQRKEGREAAETAGEDSRQDRVVGSMSREELGRWKIGEDSVGEGRRTVVGKGEVGRGRVEGWEWKRKRKRKMG